MLFGYASASKYDRNGVLPASGARLVGDRWVNFGALSLEESDKLTFAGKDE